MRTLALAGCPLTGDTLWSTGRWESVNHAAPLNSTTSFTNEGSVDAPAKS